jgi:DNA-binding transcriptional MerR regulator
MRIHELAAATGVSARSLRYYETQGLLKPHRSRNGYREYSNADVMVVDRIRWLLAAGVTTARIRAVLPCFLEEHPGQLECPTLRGQLFEEVQRISEQIASLQRSRIMLRSALNSRRNQPSRRLRA